MKHPVIALYLCLLSLSVSNAWANAKPGFLKVVLERQDHQTGNPSAEVLARLEAQSIKSYPAFTVIRVPEYRRQQIDVVARGAGFNATIHDDWDLILTPGFVVDTRDPRLPDSGVLSGYPGGDGLYVVQFDAPQDSEFNDLIEEAGLRYVSYLPYNAVLVYGSQSAVARLAAEPHVQWSSVYHPAFRAQPADLHSNDIVGRYVVQLVNVPDSLGIIEELLGEGHSEEVVSSYGPYTNLTVEVSPEVLRRLIRDPHVVAIERASEWMISGEREAVAATGSDYGIVYQDGTQPYKGTGDYKGWIAYRGLDVLLPNQLIAVADTGVSGGSIYSMHPDFQFSSISGKTYCGTGWTDFLGHGTMVAGFAAGNPQGPPQDLKGTQYFNYGMGLAPGAGVFAQRIFSSSGPLCSSVTTWAQDAIAEKNLRGSQSVVQTYSYNDYKLDKVNNVCVQVSNGVYTTDSQAFDYAVRDNSLPITVSAGNVCQFSTNAICPSPLSRPCPNMVLPPATAKNVLTVGASESYRPNMAPPCDHNTQTIRDAESYWASSLKRIAFASRRGTNDGRIKPEIVAPASMVGSSIPSTPAPASPHPRPLAPWR